jgi:hypothetical protein
MKIITKVFDVLGRVSLNLPDVRVRRDRIVYQMKDITLSAFSVFFMRNNTSVRLSGHFFTKNG